MRRLVLLAIAAAVLLLIMPRGTRQLPPASAGATVPIRGVIHVHTNRSDGTGSIDDVTRAAASAGLQFVIVTDHGDATRAPDLPDYRNDVLYIDGVEISTGDGHLVALGLPKAPYPLGGEGRDVVEDVHRLGGIAIAAHPGSPKADLQWKDWTVPIDGLEWLSADSEWRDERPATFVRALLTYPFRPPQALALLLDRPEPVIRRWDELAQQRRVVGLAAADAHARVGARSFGEPYDSAGSLHFPSYANSFREFSIALPETRLTHDASADAQAVLDAIRGGAFYTIIDALAGPASLRIAKTAERITVDAQAPDDARITLFRDGLPIANARGSRLEHAADAGVYRVEVTLPGGPGTPPVPWLMSNAVYVRRKPEGVATAATSPASDATTPVGADVSGLRTFHALYEDGPAPGWSIEKNVASDAALDVIGALPGTQLLLRFALSGSAADSPYAAFVMPASPAVAAYDRLIFTARADRPMRLSVQLRGSNGFDDRWRRSVYLDQTPRTIQLPFTDFRPITAAMPSHPDLSRVDSVLFVVDTVNMKVGSNGQIQIDNIKYAR
jgi:hypothetical protein